MTLPEDLRAAAERWRADDPDPATRTEIDDLLAASDVSGLRDRLGSELEFGTAGLRGLIGAGPNRMNRKVVLRATAGLCAYLRETTPGAEDRGVCIGFDGRTMSREFADDAARVALGMGFRVSVFPDVIPTPVLAFACLTTRAAAGIMVTASHNPPAYNGYKVYWGNGAQIIPPQDVGIAGAIGAVGSVAVIESMELGPARDAGRLTTFGPELEGAYLEGVRALMVHPELPRDLTIAYTAMHGVGDRVARAALASAGFTRVHSVPEQAEPDGAFPTVKFPNPEEAGAMDLVVALAREKKADLVLANDPDADRLAVCVPSGDGYLQLSGNDAGCLLSHYLLDQGPSGGARLVVNTIVSSPMLGSIAKAHGARFEQTLTGFKWIANTALRLEAEEGARFVFGYEEALGYTVAGLVRDKDGIGTAVVMADLAAWCASRGTTLLSEIETMWRRYGMYRSKQISEVHSGRGGAEHIASIMNRVRQRRPRSIAGRKVTAFIDLSTSTRHAADGAVSEIALPKGNVLAMELEGGHRVMLRPSGTEPKIKFYFDVRIDVLDGESAASARERGEVLLNDLAAGLAAITGGGQGPAKG